MSSTGFLSKTDLRQLTGAAVQARQIDWLRREGVPFRPNGKDELIVAWTHVHAWLEGRARPVSGGINWAAVNA